MTVLFIFPHETLDRLLCIAVKSVIGDWYEEIILYIYLADLKYHRQAKYFHSLYMYYFKILLESRNFFIYSM